MDYVEVTADLYELEKKVQTWERKVDVAAVSHHHDHYVEAKNRSSLDWSILTRLDRLYVLTLQ